MFSLRCICAKPKPGNEEMDRARTLTSVTRKAAGPTPSRIWNFFTPKCWSCKLNSSVWISQIIVHVEVVDPVR